MAFKYTISDQQETYFITTTVVEWIDVFTREVYQEVIIDSLKYCIKNKGLRLHAWCLMSNHLHLIATAGDEHGLSDIMRDFKKFTSKKIIDKIIEVNESRREWLLDKFSFAGKQNSKVKDYKVWQDGFHPVICFSYDFLMQKLDYLHNNPVRSGLVYEANHYRLSSAVDYYENRKGLITLEKIE